MCLYVPADKNDFVDKLLLKIDGGFSFQKAPTGGISGEFCPQIPRFFIVFTPHGTLRDNLSSMSVIQSFMLPSVSKTSIN